MRGRRVQSNPTSPVTKPRRTISTPEELANQDAAAQGGFTSTLGQDHLDHDGRLQDEYMSSGVHAIATVPRSRQQRHIPNAHSLFHDSSMHQQNSSLYDSVNPYSSVRRANNRGADVYENPYETVGHRASPQSQPVTMHKPIAEREIPYSQYEKSDSSSLYQSNYHTYRGAQSDPANPNALYQTVQRAQNQRSSSVEEDRLSEQELRQFSREPTILQISDRTGDQPADPLHGVTQRSSGEYDSLPAVRKQRDDLEQIRVQFKEPTYEEGRRKASTVRSQSSVSSDWPEPPSAENPDSGPDTPGINHTDFDSNTLKKMLRSLPDSSSPGDSSVRQFDFPDNTPQGMSQNSKSPTPSSEHPASNPPPQPPSREDSCQQLPVAMDTRPPPGPIKPQRIPLESGSDLPFRKSRDSYPDSGVGSLTNETVGSVKSGDSGKSGQSAKASTLPPDLPFRMTKSRDSYPDSGVGSMTNETVGSVKSGDSGKSGQSGKALTLPPGELSEN